MKKHRYKNDHPQTPVQQRHLLAAIIFFLLGQTKAQNGLHSQSQTCNQPRHWHNTKACVLQDKVQNNRSHCHKSSIAMVLGYKLIHFFEWIGLGFAVLAQLLNYQLQNRT